MGVKVGVAKDFLQFQRESGTLEGWLRTRAASGSDGRIERPNHSLFGVATRTSKDERGHNHVGRGKSQRVLSAAKLQNWLSACHGPTTTSRAHGLIAASGCTSNLTRPIFQRQLCILVLLPSCAQGACCILQNTTVNMGGPPR